MYKSLLVFYVCVLRLLRWYFACEVHSLKMFRDLHAWPELVLQTLSVADIADMLSLWCVVYKVMRWDIAFEMTMQQTLS